MTTPTERIRFWRASPKAIQPCIFPDERDTIIFDIDGCCVSVDGRVQDYIDGDIEAYHAKHHTDVPIPQGVLTYSMLLKYSGQRCVFVTQRGEEAREYTTAQLQTLFPFLDKIELLMTPVDGKPDDVEEHDVKLWMCEQHGIYPKNILMVFEDRQMIVDMWRRNGVIVYQTAPNDF